MKTSPDVFAASIGVTTDLVHEWLSGKSEIELLHALAMLSAHGVNPDWFLTGGIGRMFLATRVKLES